MTFLHELLHTAVGGSLTDPASSVGFGPIGAVETKMNIIRSQLNQNGLNFGQRSSYQGGSLTPGTGYLPFDGNSLNLLQGGVVPASTDKFILYNVKP